VNKKLYIYKREYTISNSVPCCTDCNNAKGTIDVTSFTSWVERVKHIEDKFIEKLIGGQTVSSLA